MASLCLVLRAGLFYLLVIIRRRVIVCTCLFLELGKGLLLVGIEVVKEEIVVLDAVLKVVHDFLFFVNFDAEATTLIENVLIVVHVEFSA